MNHMRALFVCLFIYMVILMSSYTVMAQGNDNKPAKALLAGGCFWCVESDLAKQDGIINVISGYAGGDRPDPNYENYYNLDNGRYEIPHLEVVEVTYDPTIKTFRDVVQYHFENIDPTDGGGQFGDRGTHYRPAVFFANEEEKKIIEDISRTTEERIQKPVMVDVLPIAKFYPAEEYHQDFAEKNPLRYHLFRRGSQRDKKIDEVWGRE